MSAFATLRLRDLRYGLKIGVGSEEREREQEISVSVELRFESLPHACHTERLDQTVCYDTLSKQIEAVARGKTYLLIETLSFDMYKALKKELPPGTLVGVSVVKVKPPIAALRMALSFLSRIGRHKSERIRLGLGGNRGDRASYLRHAIRGIRKLARVSAISPIYESDALLPEGAPGDWAVPYFNLAVRIRTELEPVALLRELKKLEKQIGRQSAERWAPREIDIDILWMEGAAHHPPELTIPHPELLKRPFAALPLADLLPHPEVALHDAIEPWLARPLNEIPFGHAGRTSPCAS